MVLYNNRFIEHEQAREKLWKDFESFERPLLDAMAGNPAFCAEVRKAAYRESWLAREAHMIPIRMKHWVAENELVTWEI
jgi:hypothetical protein